MSVSQTASPGNNRDLRGDWDFGRGYRCHRKHASPRNHQNNHRTAWHVIPNNSALSFSSQVLELRREIFLTALLCPGNTSVPICQASIAETDLSSLRKGRSEDGRNTKH